MNVFRRISIVASALAFATAGLAATAQPSFAANHVVGHVYVDNNTAPSNSISAFDQYSDGSLVAIAGSPFPAGGAGAGAIIGSQGAIQVDGKFVLAVDAGSNQVSVLRIRPN